MDYLEKNKGFMTMSKFKGYLQCPAKQWSLEKGLYVEPYSPNFLKGRYLEAGLTGDLDTLIALEAEHIFKVKGKGKYKAFEDLDKTLEFVMSKRLNLFGEISKVIEWEYFGRKWRGEIDIFRERAIDIKSTQDSLFDEEWDARYSMRVPMYIKYNYNWQLAMYAHATGTIDKGAQIISISKKLPNFIEIIEFPPTLLSSALKEIESRVGEVYIYADSKTMPKGCDKCDFCKESNPVRQLTATEYNLEDF